MCIRNLNDMFSITDMLYQNLTERICLDKNGYPIFEPEMFLCEWPDMVIPYSQRKNKLVKDKSKTVLCFYDKDHHLYPRIQKVIDEIDEYRGYMGVIGMDLTITDDMDLEWQEYILLLNQLFLAVLAVNGIKIVCNLRSARLDVSKIFNNIPNNVMSAAGFLGCESIKNVEDLEFLAKVLKVLPDKLILYGKKDKITNEQLDAMGINYRVYDDFHRLCKGGAS